MRAKHWTWLVMALLLLAAGCGEVPGAAPAQEPTPEPSSELYPPTPTPLPYPMPTAEPLPTRAPSPTPLPQPTPIVLGAEWAPLEEQEPYVSTTVVVAPVGDGPGQVGYVEHPGMEMRPVEARRFTVDPHGNIYILDIVNRRVVQFDPKGGFVTAISYGDAVQGPEELAVDAEGQVYIYDLSGSGPTPEEARPKVKLFDREGNLVRIYPIPSSFGRGEIRAMHVDEQGILWVEGNGFNPNAPIIEGQPYPAEIVPLGTDKELYDEGRQRNGAIPGLLCSYGTCLTLVNWAGTGSIDLYDARGTKTHTFPGFGGFDMLDRDRWGNLYFVVSEVTPDSGETLLYKFDVTGRILASFILTRHTNVEYPKTLVDAQGTVYCFLWNWETKDAYRVVRWQRE